MYACLHNLNNEPKIVDMLRFLVQQGADINTRIHDDDSTLLHLLCGLEQYGDRHHAALTTLLELGADVTLRESDGRLPFPRRPRRGESGSLDSLGAMGLICKLVGFDAFHCLEFLLEISGRTESLYEAPVPDLDTAVFLFLLDNGASTAFVLESGEDLPSTFSTLRRFALAGRPRWGTSSCQVDVNATTANANLDLDDDNNTGGGPEIPPSDLSV
ncbi:Uu.00g047910.m01.CDS01 [Anthostomella pinea]|uniref:Uu.00g047910.m01.CDS01 n=1 Tax=Anthostomella pinea TaxID=933095 RepID=A0AAI8V6L3_9PEZI|nr:Uu.00g047910.m01.CDS01 [Anthostomella pinea]